MLTMSTMARIKKMISLALDPELLDWLDKWRGAQAFPPSKTAVLETALRKFRQEVDPPKLKGGKRGQIGAAELGKKR